MIVATGGPDGEAGGWWVVVCDECQREAKGRADDRLNAVYAARGEGFDCEFMVHRCPDCAETEAEEAIR